MKHFLASIVAAFLAFGWGFFSWTVFHWHRPHAFTQPEQVLAAIRANAPAHAIYTLPNAADPKLDPGSAARAMEDIRRGPQMWAIIRPGPSDWSMGQNLVMSFLRSFFTALIMSAVLCRLRKTSVTCCLSTSILISMIVCLQSDATFAIWFDAPRLHVIACCADHLVEGLLMGVVLAISFNVKRGPRLREFVPTGPD